MPFTPIHMGPGIAIKAVAGRHFSLISYGIAQVAMDIEPLIRMKRGDVLLHGFTHTYAFAFLLAVIVTLISYPLIKPILDRWNKEVNHYHLTWMAETTPLRPMPVIIGAFVGTISHVALDSILYHEMQPLSPWSEENGLIGLMSNNLLTHICLFLGILGTMIWIFRARYKRLSSTM